jgi:hypothetical protein
MYFTHGTVKRDLNRTRIRDSLAAAICEQLAASLALLLSYVHWVDDFTSRGGSLRKGPILDTYRLSYFTFLSKTNV